MMNKITIELSHDPSITEGVGLQIDGSQRTSTILGAAAIIMQAAIKAFVRTQVRDSDENAEELIADVMDVVPLGVVLATFEEVFEKSTEDLFYSDGIKQVLQRAAFIKGIAEKVSVSTANPGDTIH